MVIKLGDPPFLSLLAFFKWTPSWEASLWMDTLSSSSLAELFARDRAGRFSSFLVRLLIFCPASLYAPPFLHFLNESFQHGLHGGHLLFKVVYTYCHDWHGNSLIGLSFSF